NTLDDPWSAGTLMLGVYAIPFNYMINKSRLTEECKFQMYAAVDSIRAASLYNQLQTFLPVMGASSQNGWLFIASCCAIDWTIHTRFGKQLRRTFCIDELINSDNYQYILKL